MTHPIHATEVARTYPLPYGNPPLICKIWQLVRPIFAFLGNLIKTSFFLAANLLGFFSSHSKGVPTASTTHTVATSSLEPPPTPSAAPCPTAEERRQAFEVEFDHALEEYSRILKTLDPSENLTIVQEIERFKALADHLVATYEDILDQETIATVRCSYLDPSPIKFSRDDAKLEKDFKQYEEWHQAKQSELNQVIEESVSFWTRQRQFHSKSLEKLKTLTEKYDHLSTTYSTLCESIEAEEQQIQIALISVDLAFLTLLPSLIHPGSNPPEDRAGNITWAKQIIENLLHEDEVVALENRIDDFEGCRVCYHELMDILSITDLREQDLALQNFDPYSFQDAETFIRACQHTLHQKRINLILHPLNEFTTLLPILAPLFQTTISSEILPLPAIESAESDLLPNTFSPIEFSTIEETAERRQAFEAEFDRMLEEYAMRMNLLDIKTLMENQATVAQEAEAETQRYRARIQHLVNAYGEGLDDEIRKTLGESISSPCLVMNKRKQQKIHQLVGREGGPELVRQKRDAFSAELTQYAEWVEAELEVLKATPPFNPIFPFFYEASKTFIILMVKYGYLPQEEPSVVQEALSMHQYTVGELHQLRLVHLTAFIESIKSVINTIERRGSIEEAQINEILQWRPFVTDFYRMYQDVAPLSDLEGWVENYQQLVLPLSTPHVLDHNPLLQAFLYSSLFCLERSLVAYRETLYREESDDEGGPVIVNTLPFTIGSLSSLFRDSAAPAA